MNHKAIFELLKSTGRYVWFGLLGIIGVALTALVSAPEIVTATITIAGLEVSIGVVIIAVIGSITKAIDLYIHKNKSLNSNGIAPSFLQK